MDILRRVFSDILDIDPEEIDEKTSQENTPSWDSFNNIRLIAEIRKKFNVKLELRDALHLQSFRDYYQYLKKRKKIV